MAVTICAVKDASDFRALRALFVEYEADLPADLRHGEIPSLLDDMEMYRGRNRAFLASVKEPAIGCVAVREFDSRTALLARLYVTPTARGLGAARALVDTALAFARQRGYSRIVLDTNKDALEPAYRLYRTLGFVECEPFMTVTYACPTFMELVFEA